MTAPAPAKYPSSGQLRLRNPDFKTKQQGTELNVSNKTCRRERDDDIIARMVHWNHRIRINTEEMAMVIASVLHWTI